MSKLELIKQLKQLQSIQADSEWKKRNREILLHQIGSQRQAMDFDFSKKTTYFFEYLKSLAPSKFVLRPVGVISLILVLVLGGNLASARAAQSLPGDLFYPLKIAGEKAQVTLAFSQEEKVKLEMQFTGKRLDELKKIQEQPEKSEAIKAEKIKTAVQLVKQNTENVKSRLETIKQSSGSQAAVEVAKVINDKADEYKKELSKVTEVLTEEIKQEVKTETVKAMESISEVHTTSLETIVDKKDETIASEEDIVVRLTRTSTELEERINKTKNILEEVEALLSSASLPEEIAAKLDNKVGNGEKDVSVSSSEVVLVSEKEKEAESLETAVTVEELKNKDEEESSVKSVVEKTPSDFVKEYTLQIQTIEGALLEVKKNIEQKEHSSALSKLSEITKTLTGLEGQIEELKKNVQKNISENKASQENVQDDADSGAVEQNLEKQNGEEKNNTQPQDANSLQEKGKSNGSSGSSVNADSVPINPSLENSGSGKALEAKPKFESIENTIENIAPVGQELDLKDLLSMR